MSDAEASFICPLTEEGCEPAPSPGAAPAPPSAAWGPRTAGAYSSLTHSARDAEALLGGSTGDLSGRPSSSKARGPQIGAAARNVC